ncbi:MAG: NfeD family protein [Bdellovibrionota bacterium]
MAAPFPTIVWIGPSGSRAGSAGSFITLAANIAAMAPGTNIGAAHPIQSNGEDLSSKLGEKITNDTVAFIESIAKARGRNEEMARSFVSMSTSITDEEAIKNNVIDYIAPSIDQLLKMIDGKIIKLQNNSEITINTSGSSITAYEPSIRQKALEILSNPNFFYLLFLGGLIGLGFELTHPGSIFPGVIGGICMILALIATSVLPVSFGAAALLLVGVGCMIAEFFVPSFGVLGIGGFIGFLLGSIFLVDPSDTHGLRISLTFIVPGALVVAGAGISIALLVLKSERRPVTSGMEGVKGKSAKAINDFLNGKGKVRFEGEIWNAELCQSDQDNSRNVRKGDRLTIIKIVENLRFLVTLDTTNNDETHT